MRIFFIITTLFLVSCSSTSKTNKFTEIDFEQNLSLDEFKDLINKKSSEKKFPDINE